MVGIRDIGKSLMSWEGGYESNMRVGEVRQRNLRALLITKEIMHFLVNQNGYISFELQNFFLYHLYSF